MTLTPPATGGISKENLPVCAPPVESWPMFRKRAVASAIRVVGPFVVDTSEGPLRCEDGYLAVDARGYPYPIAADEFELIYQPVSGPSDTEIHPATAALLRFFAYEHLPSHLQAISAPFCELARNVAANLDGPEATVCLRKLLEAKDCAVRAALPQQQHRPDDGHGTPGTAPVG